MTHNGEVNVQFWLENTFRDAHNAVHLFACSMNVRGLMVVIARLNGECMEVARRQFVVNRSAVFMERVCLHCFECFS